MATRIQVRRGTTSDWNTADPILNEGEIGYNITLGQIKIGDGESNWSELFYVVDTSSLGGSLSSYILSTEKSAIGGVAELDASKNILAPAGIIFEGTANDHETTLSVTDPTADRTITFPDVTGTVITTGNLSDITNIGVFSSTITMEGSTANEFELTLSAGDPTADRTITFPDETGTVQLRVTDVSDTEIGYLNGVTSAIQTQLDARVEESLFDAKGDILVASGDNTPAKLSVGTNGYILTANTSAATGIEWAAAPAGYSPPTLGSTQIASGATVTTISGLTLSSPIVSGLAVSDASIVFEGATANDFETTLTVTDPTEDRTITFPNATGTVALLTATQTFTNSKLTGSSYDSNIVDPTLVGPLKLEGGAYGVTIASSGDRENFKTWSFGTDGVLSAPGNIIFEGATANDYETTLAITDPTADRTITLPDATGTVALAENVAALSGATFTGAISGTSLTLSGDLTINGTTTTINSTTLTIDDKNIVLADGNTSDASADGGGITLSGATSKTFNWVDATDAWTSSEHMNLLTGKSYKINGTAISTALPALTWGDVKDGKSGLVIS
jgi:hypothetical protein